MRRESALVCAPAVRREGGRGVVGLTVGNSDKGRQGGDRWQSRGWGERRDVTIGAPPCRRIIIGGGGNTLS
jgi:hypothetical protein